MYFLNMNCVIYLLLLNKAYRVNSYTAKKEKKTMCYDERAFFQ